MIQSILYSLIAGVGGTALGGAIALLFPRRSLRSIGVLLNLVSGLMMAVVCFDLIPSSLVGLSPVGVVIAVLFGADFLWLVSYLGNRRGGGFTSATMMAIGIALHNLPEGLIIGTGDAIDRGLAMALIVGLHDVPEGMAVCAPLIAEGKDPMRALGLSILSGIPTVIGAVIGRAVALIHPTFLSIASAVASGAMLYVVYSDTISEAKRLYPSRFSGIIIIIGILVGLVITDLL